MKVNCFLLPLLLVAIGTSCSSNGDGSLSVITDANHNEVIICDVAVAKDTLTVPLSEWVEDCKLVRFEDSDTALFKFWWPAITEHYIGIRPRRGCFKLFNHDGKFLCDVGRIGNAPGEYSSLVYSEAIDETGQCIYLASFDKSSKLLKYHMDGTFADEIEIGETLNKPKLTLHADGSLSIVHLFFETSTIWGAHISKEGEVSTFAPSESSSIFSEREWINFNEETWCFNNVADMKFSFTYCDTLFRYDEKLNQVKPEFTLQGLPEEERYIFNPLPDKYLINTFSKGTLVADLKRWKSYYVRLQNDYWGHLPVSRFNFSNGWFFAMYEPAELMDVVEKRLMQPNCTDKDRSVLRELLDSLDEDDNNVMFIGKLK